MTKAIKDYMCFSKKKIGNLSIRNRFVRSATWTGYADQLGSVTQALIHNTLDVINGHVGLFILEHSHVSEEGQGSEREIGLHNNNGNNLLRELIKQVHEQGGIIFAQLEHAGVHGNQYVTGLHGKGPSAMSGYVDRLNFSWDAYAMTKTEIKDMIHKFGDAAKRVKDCGFDGVQIHAAHTYLIGQFLSPFYNKRTDEWGGELTNRMRFLMEVYSAIREAVGDNYPVIAKINSKDGLKEQGVDLNDVLTICKALETEGMDAVEMSGGSVHPDALFRPYRQHKKSMDNFRCGYWYDEAVAYKENILTMPLVLVGGIRDLQIAEKLIQDGVTDFVSMARPFICEPGLIARWESGDIRSAECTSCDSCRIPLQQGHGIYCVRKAKMLPSV